MKDLLRDLRHQKGATLKEVAAAIGITLSAYSNYEQGLREPSLQILKRICEYFEISADYFLDLETDTGAKLYTNTPPTPAALPLDETELLKNYRALSYVGKARVAAYTDLLREQEEGTTPSTRKKA